MSRSNLVPASPKKIVPWVKAALQNGPMERSALLTAVEVFANAEGFKIEDNALKLKKALAILKDDKEVTNIRQGWWSISEKSKLAVKDNPDKLVEGKQSIEVHREIGEGKQKVYVYQFKEDVERAKEKELDWWNCKIGKSNNAGRRLTGSNTYIVKSPEVGLLINCQDCTNLEKFLKWSLREAGQSEKHDAGHEWFRTSPQHVETFYRTWLQACDSLKR